MNQLGLGFFKQELVCKFHILKMNFLLIFLLLFLSFYITQVLPRKLF